MNRGMGWPALALVVGLATPSFGQFGGMGGGMGSMGGGRMPTVLNFGAAGAESPKAIVCPVKIVASDGKTTTGGLRLTAAVIGCSFGIYEIKPEKVQEIRFGTASANLPVVVGQGGTQRAGQVVTTTGEVIDGTVLIPGWWRVETDLGLLAPSPEAIRSISFLKHEDVPEAGVPAQLESIPAPRGAAPNRGGDPNESPPVPRR